MLLVEVDGEEGLGWVDGFGEGGSLWFEGCGFGGWLYRRMG